MKFLVVDDSGLARRTVLRSLKELGHATVEAVDGPQALERFVLEKPDFVILDLMMPGMTGYQVLDALRAIDHGCRVIICSADIQKSTKDIVRKAGALAIINKPVTTEQIAAALNTILSGQNPWQ